MGDDLAAFFAKKAHKKSKKKNIVSLDDVGQQLERKVKIQETGFLETEESVAKATNEVVCKTQQSNEDSEWIECNEKPSIVGIAFKQLTDNLEDDIEKEKKNLNTENTKTWNIINKSEVAPVEPVLKQQKYQAPSSRRAGPLNINDKEMFPSIADADGIAEKLKAEEKKRLKNPEVLRSSLRSDTQRNSTENTQRTNDHSNFNSLHRKNLHDSKLLNNENSYPTSGYRPQRTLANDYSDNSASDGVWRRSAIKTQEKSVNNLNTSSKADESSSWRSKKSSATITPRSQQVEATPKKDLYVPPHKKNISLK